MLPLEQQHQVCDHAKRCWQRADDPLLGYQDTGVNERTRSGKGTGHRPQWLLSDNNESLFLDSSNVHERERVDDGVIAGSGDEQSC